jgi:hypothetical protein
MHIICRRHKHLGQNEKSYIRGKQRNEKESRSRRRRRSDILTINDHDTEVVKEFQIPINCNQ